MSQAFQLPLISFAVVSAIMIFTWIIAYKIKNAGIVDILWAFNFLFIAFVIWLLADGASTRKNLVCFLAGLWSIRLGIYLLIRVGSHLNKEEGRYQQLRSEWAPNANLKFFIFFQMQALSNVFLAIPFFIIAINPAPTLSIIEYIGAAFWLLFIIGEGLSDYQLQQFKKKSANKGKVCNTGFWNYSRHPNYFFQFMLWIAVFILALPSPYGWISIICPIVIGLLIFKVTGIPMTEEQSIRSKGDLYKEYQRTTSVFIPWFKKI